jgi:hypothetical protein
MGPEEGIRWADARGIAVLYLMASRRDAVRTRASRAFEKIFTLRQTAPGSLLAPWHLGTLALWHYFLNSPHVSICEP